MSTTGTTTADASTATTTDMVGHVLTLYCPETPGIVHAVSGFLGEHDCDTPLGVAG